MRTCDYSTTTATFKPRPAVAPPLPATTTLPRTVPTTNESPFVRGGTDIMEVDEDVSTAKVVEEVEVSLPSPVPTDPVVDAKAISFLLDLEHEFNTLLDLLAVAIRSGDQNGIDRVRERIREFERQRIERVATDLLDEKETDMVERVRDRLRVLIADALTRTEKRERIVIDRVGDKVTRDSDRDGVSDYDEVNIYTTDPFVADSDKDGFTDGAEVLAGYDPKNDAGEIMVTYEDPKTDGIERDDLPGDRTLSASRWYRGFQPRTLHWLQVVHSSLPL